MGMGVVPAPSREEDAKLLHQLHETLLRKNKSGKVYTWGLSNWCSGCLASINHTIAYKFHLFAMKYLFIFVAQKVTIVHDLQREWP